MRFLITLVTLQVETDCVQELDIYLLYKKIAKWQKNIPLPF